MVPRRYKKEGGHAPRGSGGRAPVQLCGADAEAVGYAPRDARPWPVRAPGTRVASGARPPGGTELGRAAACHEEAGPAGRGRPRCLVFGAGGHVGCVDGSMGMEDGARSTWLTHPPSVVRGGDKREVGRGGHVEAERRGAVYGLQLSPLPLVVVLLAVRLCFIWHVYMVDLPSAL